MRRLCRGLKDPPATPLPGDWGRMRTTREPATGRGVGGRGVSSWSASDRCAARDREGVRDDMTDENDDEPETECQCCGFEDPVGGLKSFRCHNLVLPAVLMCEICS